MTGFWKLLGATGLLAGLVVTAVALLTWPLVVGQAERALQARAVAEAELLAAWAAPRLAPKAVPGANPAEEETSKPGLQLELQTAVLELSRRLPDLRLTLVAPDGTVLADSDETPGTMENHGQRPEILDSGRPGSVPAPRTSATTWRQDLYFAVPIRHDGELLAHARVALPLTPLAGLRARFGTALGFACLVAAVAALAISALLAYAARRPPEELRHYVSAVARGDRPPALAVHRFDALAPLAKAVQTMADRLHDRLQELLRERSETRAILASMVEGVLAIDPDRRVMLLNASAAGMLETTEAVARGKPVWEVTRVPEVTDLLTSCLRTGRRADGEVVLAGDPHDRVLRLTASPLADGSQVWGAVLVLDDLTGLRQLETVRRDFVVNVSHELKTPLTAMRGFLEAVVTDESMDERTRRRFLGKVRDNTDRMVAIVSDLLTLARLEAAGAGPQHVPLDLREIAAETAADGTGAASIREVSIVLDMSGEAVTVRGERAALVTALSNLVDNAVKYSPPGSRVHVRVGRQGHEAVVEVQDRGPGISAHDQERIFERFYRVEKSRSRELGGTGLGLSIVRHVVQLHGGTVSVESSPGQGSAFRIRLPLQKGPAATV